MTEFKRESRVEGGCDIIQSRHQNKRDYFSMQKKVRGSCFILCGRLVVVLCDWMTSHPLSTPLSLLNKAIFELSIMEGNSIENL